MATNTGPLTTLEPRAVEITIHCCTGVSANLAFGLVEKKRDYFVEATIDSEAKRTGDRRRRDQKLEWNEKLMFNNVKSSSMTLSLYCRRTSRDPKLVKQLTYPVSELDGIIVRTASFPDGPEITFSLRSIPSHDAAGETICQVKTGDNGELYTAKEQAKQALESRYTPKHDWKRLLEGIESFRDLVGGMAEVHPYAKIAHSVLFAIPGIFIEQLKLDEDIQILFDSFACFCDIVSTLKDSNMNESGKFGDVLKRISLQMTQVGYFVRDYCKERNFLKNALKNKFSSVSDTIQEYRDKIEELKDEFHTRLVIQTGTIVARTEIKVTCVFKELETIGQAIDLNDILYVPGAGLNADRRCLAGTRESFLGEIEEWVNSDGPRTLLISGGAGTGKSSIAHTIAARFQELGRLGSVFCFSEDEKATRKPTSLLPNIARDLADLDQHIRGELAKAVQNKADRTTSSITTQFEKFILIPANAIRENLHGPIVIVIDALDESGPVAERQVLLKVLAERLKELPPNFRIIITSRPDPDIEQGFKRGSDILIKRMHTIPLDSTTLDITAYVKSQLADSQDIGDDKRQRLALHARGLFQWASVACKFIRAERLGETALDRYEELIQPLTHDAGAELIGDSLLDYLYRMVLSRVLSPESKAQMAKFKFVMARVLTAFEPLSSKSLNKFTVASKLAPKNCNVENVVAYLGSLLSGVDDQETPIRPLHTSFRNFLADPTRSKDFFVDVSIPDVHSDMSLASMQIMSDELTFNICRLSTSYLPNNKIPGIKQSIKRYISPHLSYACRFWSTHLLSLRIIGQSKSGVQSPVTVNRWSEIVVEVNGLLSRRLLYYLEVLSLGCGIDYGLQQMRVICAWFKEGGADEDIILLVRDAAHFFSYFAKCIATSVPHIYISALPFAPRGSLVSKNYDHSKDRMLTLVSGQLENYPSCLNVLHGHTNAVSSVGFSADGTRIVSSSWDRTIRVWNAESGEKVIGPLEGHTNWIASVGFSPDGTRIVSGSYDKTIRIWNAENGEMVVGPLEGHTNWVRSTKFSPNGARVVSGSEDNTIRVWNAQNGKMVIGPLEGHTSSVASVAFSSDGTRIVSGSDDNTIRIWSVESGKMVVGPLKGHTDRVTSVAFSPDNTRIVSGSYDKTIQVWNAENGKIMIGPLEGHTRWIRSVAFSPDGTLIVSGADDTTIRIWSAENGDMIAGPLEGHTNWIRSVGFSPDGARIVSGSSDRTIRIWNAENGQAVVEPLEGHTSRIRSVRFSPDGTRIVSSADDNTIRIWNAQNGKGVIGPLKGHMNPATSVAFSPDGTRVVSGSIDSTIRIWNTENGDMVIGPLEGHTNRVTSVAFSPDGTHIVSGSSDKTIRFWNVQNGKMTMGLLEGHTDSVTSVAFSPDGTKIVSGSDDNTIRVWSVEDGKMVIGPLEGHIHWVTSVAFSPDGTRIVSGSYDNTIRVWDAKNGKMVIQSLEGHTNSVTSVAFSPDGTHIVSCSDDRTIRVWNAQSGKMATRPLEGHTNVITSVAFSPDGTCIVSGSFDHTVRVHSLPGYEALSKVPSKDVVAPETSSAAHASDHISTISLYDPEQVVPQDYWHVEDGWSLGVDGELLFYIPPVYRANFYHPKTTVIISTEMSTRLDMTRFAHGSRWTECFRD